MSFQTLFPFGVWTSTSPRARWKLDFNEDGCVWQEFSSSGNVLRRVVPLQRTTTGLRIERPNDNEVLAFLGASARVIPQIIAAGASPSFIDLHITDNQFRGTWNGLRWTLTPQGDLNHLDQPGLTPMTMSEWEFAREGDDSSYYSVSNGQFTFDVEGHEGEPFHSRWIHHPSPGSGITLGRGYDMAHGMSQTASEIARDLREAGLTSDLASQFAEGAGLTGTTADRFVTDNRTRLGNITPGQQKKLFESTWLWHANDVIRICMDPYNIQTYGAVDFPGLHEKIRTILVDLRYAGHYNPETRVGIQRFVAMNDLRRFTIAMGYLGTWGSVYKKDERRFTERLKYLGGRIYYDPSSFQRDLNRVQ